MPGTLISAAQLAEELGSTAPPALLDVRWRLGGPPGRVEWAGGHIPGAAYVDLDTDLAAEPGAGGRHPLPDAERFAEAMRSAGVRMDRGVVVYDAVGGMSAARAWWLLRFHGHPSVRVLDGGLRAWADGGRGLQTGETAGERGDFTPSAVGAMPLLDAAAAADLARTGVLLDARAGERYRGEVEPVDARAGHIPGARSAPADANLDPATSRFLPAGALRHRFATLGAAPGIPVGAYCGSGVTAAQEVLALEVAGIAAALYAGSWSNWITDESRPVATGADPG